MNILITGASRGIGAAAYELLKSRGHKVVGHSSRGDGELVAGDLMDPAAPRAVWDEALNRLDGRIEVLINNAGIFEGVAEDAPDDEWHAAWDAHDAGEPAVRRATLAGSRSITSANEAKADASSTCPAGPPTAATRPSIGIMRRPRPAWQR